MSRRFARVLQLVLLALPAAPVALAGEPEPAWWHGELSLSTGLDWSAGDYGDPIDTRIAYVPVTARYVFDALPLTSYPWDQVEVGLTVPWIRIDGPGDFFTDTGGALQLRRVEEDGLGDVLLHGTYIWLPAVGSRWPAVELTGRVKLPTANADRGLGTGETDTWLEVDLARKLGPVTPYLTLGYRFVGRPRGTRLDSSWYATAGFSWSPTRRLSLGLLYDWSGAATPDRHDSHELVPYLSYALGPRLTLSPYAVFGLSGYTPEYAVGFSLRYRIPFHD